MKMEKLQELRMLKQDSILYESQPTIKTIINQLNQSESMFKIKLANIIRQETR